MTISICIPVFNFQVDGLVSELDAQIKKLNIAGEIIVIDDGSKDTIKDHNRRKCKNVKYLELRKNIGRAAIRNLFLQHTSSDYMLFLDCDSIVHREGFLDDYIKAIERNPQSVICGGREYDKTPCNRNKKLRWKYGIERESKSSQARAIDPNVSFMTNNFIIERKLFDNIRFDEGIVEYGHEDTLFGFELKKRKVDIIHINNPILNGHLEDNTEYIQNTEKAISNLTFILERTNYNEHLIKDITLLRIFYKYYNMKGIVSVLFLFAAPLIKFLLARGFISLHLFDFYKIGVLSRELTLHQR